MAINQTASAGANLAGARDLLKEEVARKLHRNRPEDSKYLEYAALALYIDAELDAIGIEVTQSIISALHQADYNAMMSRDAYADNRDLFGDDEGDYARDAALEKLDENWKQVDEARLYYERKNLHSPKGWASDVLKVKGDACEVVIDEICRHVTNFSDSATLAIEIINSELGSSAYIVVEVLKEAVMYIENEFYRAARNIRSEAYIHPMNPKYSLRNCAKNKTIPDPMIKKVLAIEEFKEWF